MATTVMNEETLNLDKNVTVRSIAGWNTGFQRLASIGDVTIPPYGNTRLTANEIVMQVQNNRILFTGTDGQGSHATLYIDDDGVRKYLGFDSEDGKHKQAFLNDEAIKKLFDLKTQKTFENNFKELVQTRAEKRYAMRAIRQLGLNDYNKIRFAEDYTGFRVDQF